eukprot:1184025-Rhodomonas_salina.2
MRAGRRVMRRLARTGTVRAKEEAMEFAAFILDGIQYMEQVRDRSSIPGRDLAASCDVTCRTYRDVT